MEIKVLEKNENRIKFEIDDRMFVNLLNEEVWELGKGESAWKQEHPYTAKPEFLITAKNPKEVLLDAAEAIEKDAEKIKKGFEKEI